MATVITNLRMRETNQPNDLVDIFTADAHATTSVWLKKSEHVEACKTRVSVSRKSKAYVLGKSAKVVAHREKRLKEMKG